MFMYHYMAYTILSIIHVCVYICIDCVCLWSWLFGPLLCPSYDSSQDGLPLILGLAFQYRLMPDRRGLSRAVLRDLRGTMIMWDLYPSIHLSIHLSICLCICMFPFVCYVDRCIYRFYICKLMYLHSCIPVYVHVLYLYEDICLHVYMSIYLHTYSSIY